MSRSSNSPWIIAKLSLQMNSRKSRWQHASSRRNTARGRNSFPPQIHATNASVPETSTTRPSPTIPTAAKPTVRSICDSNHSCSEAAFRSSQAKSAAQSTGNAVSSNSRLMHADCQFEYFLAKSSKKVIKRSVDESDETTEKGQTVFVVTPSKNMEQFLAAIESANPVWSTLPDSPVTEASTTTTAIPTLSTDPFQAPSDFTTIPVSATAEESTTPLERAFAEFSTEAFTSKAETPTTESTTTEQANTTFTSTTTEAQTTKKSSSEEYISLSSELNESSGSDETEETKESNETSAPTTSTTTAVPYHEIDVRSSAPLEASTTTTTTTTEEPTSKASTTTLSSEIQKAIQDIGRSLEAFEDPLTTIVPQTTTQEARETSSAYSSTTEGSTTVTVTESTSTESSTLKVVEDQPTTTSSLSESTTPTFPGLSPTDLDKLLSTLRQYDAQVEALTSTPPPLPLLSEGVQVEMKTEFVNYTVSSESREFKDEPRPIAKRSVPDVDLIPRYFKHIAAAKEKGCAYNGRSFKLGEVIKTDNECLKCFCEYAPIGHCVLKEKCNF